MLGVPPRAGRDSKAPVRHEELARAPQVIKVYRHLNCEASSTVWKVGSKRVATYARRPLLDYERTFAPALDPDYSEAHARRPNAKVGK